ncbi:uncharacterized protein LOC135992470 [Caloenas nicobarica]|uniref:uncharacterized protein LOC135992470 n=1 Tax=Caloenas nicobarica TaxID=187106 RepID=UPI0032B77D8C
MCKSACPARGPGERRAAAAAGAGGGGCTRAGTSLSGGFGERSCWELESESDNSTNATGLAQPHSLEGHRNGAATQPQAHAQARVPGGGAGRRSGATALPPSAGPPQGAPGSFWPWWLWPSIVPWVPQQRDWVDVPSKVLSLRWGWMSLRKDNSGGIFPSQGGDQGRALCLVPNDSASLRCCSHFCLSSILTEMPPPQWVTLGFPCAAVDGQRGDGVRGGYPEQIDLIHKNYRKLCNLLIDVEEWGQVVIINMLTRYAHTQFLSPNQNAVMAVAQLYFHMAPQAEVVSSPRCWCSSCRLSGLCDLASDGLQPNCHGW